MERFSFAYGISMSLTEKLQGIAYRATRFGDKPYRDYRMNLKLHSTLGTPEQIEQNAAQEAGDFAERFTGWLKQEETLNALEGAIYLTPGERQQITHIAGMVQSKDLPWTISDQSVVGYKGPTRTLLPTRATESIPPSMISVTCGTAAQFAQIRWDILAHTPYHIVLRDRRDKDNILYQEYMLLPSLQPTDDEYAAHDSRRPRSYGPGIYRMEQEQKRLTVTSGDHAATTTEIFKHLGSFPMRAHNPYQVWALLSSVQRSPSDWNNPTGLSGGGGFRKPVWEGGDIV